MSFLNRILRTLFNFSWPWKIDVVPMSDDSDPVSDDDEQPRGSHQGAVGNSEGSQSVIGEAPDLLPDHNPFDFYTPDPFSSNALTKAFRARSSQKKHSFIQVSTMKLLRFDARVGGKYTLPWQVEELEQRFSTTFEAIPDNPDEFQVILGTERSIDVVEDQSCVSSDQQLQSQSSTRDETQTSSNDQVQLGSLRVIAPYEPYDTSHSESTHTSKVLKVEISIFTSEGCHQEPRVANGFNLGEKINRANARSPCQRSSMRLGA